MLYMTRVELELLSNADRYLFYETSVRGGVYYIYKIFSQANKIFKS